MRSTSGSGRGWSESRPPGPTSTRFLWREPRGEKEPGRERRPVVLPHPTDRLPEPVEKTALARTWRAAHESRGYERSLDLSTPLPERLRQLARELEAAAGPKRFYSMDASSCCRQRITNTATWLSLRRQDGPPDLSRAVRVAALLWLDTIDARSPDERVRRLGHSRGPHGWEAPSESERRPMPWLHRGDRVDPDRETAHDLVEEALGLVPLDSMFRAAMFTTFAGHAAIPARVDQAARHCSKAEDWSEAARAYTGLSQPGVGTFTIGVWPDGEPFACSESNWRMAAARLAKRIMTVIDGPTIDLMPAPARPLHTTWPGPSDWTPSPPPPARAAEHAHEAAPAAKEPPAVVRIYQSAVDTKRKVDDDGEGKPMSRVRLTGPSNVERPATLAQVALLSDMARDGYREFKAEDRRHGQRLADLLEALAPGLVSREEGEEPPGARGGRPVKVLTLRLKAKLDLSLFHSPHQAQAAAVADVREMRFESFRERGSL